MLRMRGLLPLAVALVVAFGGMWEYQRALQVRDYAFLGEGAALRTHEPSGQIAFPMHFDFHATSDKVVLRTNDGTNLERRLKVKVGYRLETPAALQIRLPNGEYAPDSFELPGDTDQRGNTWEKSVTVAPGPFRIELQGPPGSRGEITDLQITQLRATPRLPNIAKYVPWLACVLLIAVPVYWCLTPYPKLGQWFLILVSAVVLLKIQALFTIILFAFVSILYSAKLGFQKWPKSAWLLLLVLIGLCVGGLGVVKYAPTLPASFFVGIGAKSIVFPLGASYFFFRLTDVLLSWYRGEQTERSFREYLCYMTFLPTVPAGPIETLDSFCDSRLPKLEADTIVQALLRILQGIAKKYWLVTVLLQPYLFARETGLLDQVTLNPEHVSHATVVLFAVCSLLFAYFDLSAYSDFAIGAGLLFGHRIRENFAAPLLKRNIASFWQSYHVSLGQWCQRNVFWPMLISSRSTVLALFASFFVMGIWHHINLNWTCWAIHHAAGVVAVTAFAELVDRYFRPRLAFLGQSTWCSTLAGRVWLPCAVALTILYAAAGTCFVFVDDFPTALGLYLRLLTFQ